jgi:hypothetical protein
MLRNIAFSMLAFATLAAAQSTFGSFVGTVRDPSGAVIGGAMVQVTNKGTSAQRTATTDENGSFNVVNLDPGTYDIIVEAPGFQRSVHSNLVLTARQTARVDATLGLGAQTEAITVNTAAEPVITTEVSALAETKSGRELVDLPIAIASRAAGSTSPITTLTTQTGVQTDTSGNISIAGSKPAMVSFSLDGITNSNPKMVNGAAPVLTELFPSFNSIAEIRVSEINNSAEFSGVSDVTTISKGGTNAFHGGLFENLQNNFFNARNTFSATVPKLILNDFGGNVSGPVRLGKLYEGRNRTFFFATYEGLQLPKETVLVESVPSLALRQGDLSFYKTVIKDPTTGQPFTNNQIPITPLAQTVLQNLFPLPNAIGPNAVTNNFVKNYPAPLTSNQGDIRIDHNLHSRQTVFARFSYKRRLNTTAPSGSYFLGPTTATSNDANLTVAHNFVINSAMVNEFRFGFSSDHTGTTQHYMSQDAAATLFGLAVPRPLAPGAGAPNFSITGFQATSGGGFYDQISRASTLQIINNFTYVKGTHNVKVGADYRHPSGFYDGVWAGFRLGTYRFTSSVTNSIIGNPFAAFLLGIPDQTNLVTVTTPDMDAYSNHYALYAQDDWKVTPRLTLNYGLRWEYHPSFMDRDGNLTGFFPNYYSNVNGQQVHGALVVPDKGLANVDPDFIKSVAPMPILTGSQAGIPQAMRYSDKTDFAPRIGFAWRPFSNNRTVIRGGYGRYFETLLGGIASLGWGLATANNGTYNQTLVGGRPTLNFPYPFPSNLAQPGTQSLADLVDLHYHDPYVQQWNFTVERDLGFSTGLRLTYDGSRGSRLGFLTNINQVPKNTLGYAAVSSQVPYPTIGYSPIETNGATSNYHAGTVALTKRFSDGLQFATSYVYARHLSNEGGYNPSGFAGEYGGTVTDRFDPDHRLDYGNVPYTRRHRFLSTFVYDLPVGKGKRFAGKVNTAADKIIGGWELAGVLEYQSGPFLTITVPSADPSGTGFSTLVGSGRADIVPGVSLTPSGRTIFNWINKQAFAVPPNNVGRWPTSGVGILNGPGTQVVSLSMFKSVAVSERVRFQLGASAANLFNHPNYAAPNTSFNTAAFGTIGGMQSADGAGPRALQFGARLTF